MKLISYYAPLIIQATAGLPAGQERESSGFRCLEEGHFSVAVEVSVVPVG